MQAKSERFELRLEQNVLDRLDSWRAGERDLPTRAEAIRRLMDIGFEHHSNPALKISDGEKLLFVMMREVHKALKIKNPEVAPDFVADAIYGGHYWALQWQFPGLFHNARDDESAVREVVDFLDMWDCIETAAKKIGKNGLAMVSKSGLAYADYVRFPGFDGNNEATYLEIARFLIEKMDRFTIFKDHELNSHVHVVDRYRRMYAIFEPMRKTLIGRDLDANQVIEILNAMPL